MEAAFGLFQEFDCLSALADDVEAPLKIFKFRRGRIFTQELSVSG